MYVIGSPRDIYGFVGRVITGSTTYDQTLNMCASIPRAIGAATRGVGPCSLLVVFGLSSVESFWFAGLDLSGDLCGARGSGLVIGRYSGNRRIIENNLQVTEGLTRGENHQLTVDIAVAGSAVEITLAVDDDPAWEITADTTTDFVYDGGVGFGSYGSSMNVHNYGVGAACSSMVC